MLHPILAGGMLATALLAAPAGGAPPGFVFPSVCCYLDGVVVRTVTPPAAMPNEGTDALYAIEDGAEGQLAVVAVGPGDAGYQGGKWAVHVVAWSTEPYLLTSDEDVLAAEDAGDMTVTRNPDADFKCPIQP